MRIWLIAASMLCGTAMAEPVREGAAAYGDWRTDQPGVERHISADALPPPYATSSSSRGPRVVPRPAGALPSVPPGFRVDIWATGLDMPRAIRVAPNGDVFLAESGAGRIRVWRPHPGGDAGVANVFASGLDQPFGIAFWPPAAPRYVYVAETSQVVRYPYSGGLQADGAAQVVVPHLPEGGHWTRDLAASPDGRLLYVSVGSASNVASGMKGEAHDGASAAEAGQGYGAEAGRAAVLSFSPDGSGMHLVASGLRNCVSLAIQPKTNRLWCAVNERDGMGDDLPPDYATSVQPGAFYGWPWFYIGAHEDPRHRGERPDLANRVTIPDVLIQPHSAPLGIAFYEGSQFPPDYAGDAFVAVHGSWNRAKRTGYKVIRLHFHDGIPTGSYEDFMTGFVSSDAAVWGRPVGVGVLTDGSLLVSEDGNGTVYRIRYAP